MTFAINVSTHLMVAFASTAAMISQLAVQRAPEICEPQIIQSIRRLKIVSWCTVSAISWVSLAMGQDSGVQLALLSFVALALADTLTAISRLFDKIQISDGVKTEFLDTNVLEFRHNRKISRILQK